MNGARVRALRYAREMVSDMRWRGMTVPPLYIRMAEEFQGLVRSGAYAAWVASQDSSRRRIRSGWAGSQQPRLITPIGDGPATGRCEEQPIVDEGGFVPPRGAATELEGVAHVVVGL